MTFNQRLKTVLRQGTSGLGRVVGVLALALVLAFLPNELTAQLRGLWQTALRPSLQITADLKQQTAELRDRWQGADALGEQLDAAQQQLAELEAENRRLANQLLDLQRSLALAEQRGADSDDLQPLVVPRFVEARVIGQQGRALLNQLSVIDAGRAEQILPESLVLDGSDAVLDLGDDAHLKHGHLVLDGYRVWGKVVEVGPRVSRMMPVDAAEFRDIVLIVDAEDSDREHGRGMLEGAGEGTCRIRLVDITQPVVVGDRVYSAVAVDELAPKLLYGVVEQVEREPGAPHWDIRVRPALTNETPTRVTVLTSELNPVRLANRPK